MTDNNKPLPPEDRIADDPMFAERLRDMDRDGRGRATDKKKRSPALLVTGLLGLSALGTVGYLATSGGSDVPQLTSGGGDGFLTEPGQGFGAMPPPQEPEIVEREVVVEAPANTEMQQVIDELRRQVDDLRSSLADATAPKPDAAPSEDPRFAELSAEMERLREADAKRTADMERVLREKELEMQRLQSELDLARLGGGNAPRTPGIDPAIDERARAAEEARLRAREIQEKRVVSGMIAFGGGAGSGGDGAGAGEQEAARLSDNEAFVRNAGKPAVVERASVIVNPGNTVMQGTMIQAILETAINSTLPGSIRAVVSEDVHSYDGTRVLIPRGSVVIGKYSEGVALGQRRALVAWERIIMPDNQSVVIAAYGGDELGQSGVTGRVNSNFGLRFGSAALISLISVLPALATPEDADETTQDLADGVGQNLQGASQSAVAEYLTIKPTIHVNQGSRVTIMVDRDLEIF